MENEMTQVNGSDVSLQVDQPDANRKYCDTCKFSQIWLGSDQLQMMCRKNPPQALGNFLGVQQGPQVVPQLFSQTVWPIITKMDWCDAHEDDPKLTRNAVKTSSVIAGTDRHS